METEWLVIQIERFISERDSGFGLPDDLTPLEKELVMLWDQIVKQHERAHQMRIQMIIERMSQVQ